MVCIITIFVTQFLSFSSLSVTGLGVAAPNAAFASMVNVFGLAGIVGKHFCDLSQVMSLICADWEAA